jgi:hypothetical protein
MESRYALVGLVDTVDRVTCADRGAAARHVSRPGSATPASHNLPARGTPKAVEFMDW